MKSQHVWRIILLVAVALTFTLGETDAQRRRGRGNGMPRYDTSTEVTMKGTVEKVESQIATMGWNGTHLLVNFDGRSMEVHLGPTSYLERNNFAFAKGDQVEVTGSKVRMGGADVLLAREVKAGDRTLKLRDAQGIPLWSGGGSRNP